MNRTLLSIAALLLAVSAVRVAVYRSGSASLKEPLETFPTLLGGWTSSSELPVVQGVRRVLKADDILSRDYTAAGSPQVHLFVAYYKTQRAGEMMHSPRNCLPGSGWEPLSFTQQAVDLGGVSPVPVDRYLIQKEGTRLLVLYWYQEHGRILTSELENKLALVWDGLRGKGRDGALVRLSVTLDKQVDERAAMAAMNSFLHRAGPALHEKLDH